MNDGWAMTKERGLNYYSDLQPKNIDEDWVSVTRRSIQQRFCLVVVLK